MIRQSCSFTGQCEDDDLRGRQTPAQCQATCRPLNDAVRDLSYLTLELAGVETMMRAALSDRSILVRRMSGVTVPGHASATVLLALANRDYHTLYNFYLHAEYPFRAYLRDEWHLDDFDFFILAAIDAAPYQQLDWAALRLSLTLDLEQVFEGVDENFRDDLRPTNAEELLLRVQTYVADVLDRHTSRIPGNNGVALAAVQEQWPLLQELFGAELPYQDTLAEEN
jgi:hypothetical protein